MHKFVATKSDPLIQPSKNIPFISVKWAIYDAIVLVGMVIGYLTHV